MGIKCFTTLNNKNQIMKKNILLSFNMLAAFFLCVCNSKSLGKFESFVQHELISKEGKERGLYAFFFYGDGGCNACVSEYTILWKNIINDKRYSFQGVYISARPYTQKTIAKQLAVQIETKSINKDSIDGIKELEILPLVVVIDSHSKLLFSHTIGKINPKFPNLSSEKIIEEFKHLFSRLDTLKQISSVKLEEKEDIIYSANIDIKEINSGYAIFDSKSMKLIKLAKDGKIFGVTDLNDKNNITSTITQIHEVLLCGDTLYCIGLEIPKSLKKGDIDFPLPTLYTILKNKIISKNNVRNNSIMPPLIPTYKGTFFKIFDWVLTDSNSQNNKVNVAGYFDSKNKRIKFEKLTTSKSKGNTMYSLANDRIKFENDSCIYQLENTSGMLLRFNQEGKADTIIARKNDISGEIFIDFLLGEDKLMYVVSSDSLFKNYAVNVYEYNGAYKTTLKLPKGFNKLVSVEKNSNIDICITRETGIYIDKYSY